MLNGKDRCRAQSHGQPACAEHRSAHCHSRKVGEVRMPASKRCPCACRRPPGLLCRPPVGQHRLTAQPLAHKQKKAGNCQEPDFPEASGPERASFARQMCRSIVSKTEAAELGQAPLFFALPTSRTGGAVADGRLEKAFSLHFVASGETNLRSAPAAPAAKNGTLEARGNVPGIEAILPVIPDW